MFETFFMKYKEPIKYGFIKLLQLRMAEESSRNDYVELSPIKYNTGIGTPFPTPPPVSEIKYYDPEIDGEPNPAKKRKDPTKDYHWPAAVKSNGGIRGSKATTHRRFR